MSSKSRRNRSGPSRNFNRMPHQNHQRTAYSKHRSNRWTKKLEAPFRILKRLGPLRIIKDHAYDDLKQLRRLMHYRRVIKNLARKSIYFDNASFRNEPAKKPRNKRNETLPFTDEQIREICKKRKDRRNSLFFFKKAGKGVSGPKIRDLKPESKVDCRRVKHG